MVGLAPGTQEVLARFVCAHEMVCTGNCRGATALRALMHSIYVYIYVRILICGLTTCSASEKAVGAACVYVTVLCICELCGWLCIQVYIFYVYMCSVCVCLVGIHRIIES